MPNHQSMTCPPADMREADDRVRAHLTELRRRGQQLPARPGHPDKVHYGAIEEAAGVYNGYLAKPAGRAARLEVDAAVLELGLQDARAELEREVVTLAAAGGLLCDAVRRRQEERSEYSGPTLKRARALIKLLIERDAMGAGGSAAAAAVAFREALAAGKIKNGADFEDILGELETLLEAQSAGLCLPSSFCGALEVVMAAKGVSAGELAKRVDLKEMQIVRWRSGERVPDERSEPRVREIERELGLEPEELVKRIERRRAGRGRVAKGRYPVDLQTPEKAVRRSEISRRLKPEALFWDTASLHALIRDIDKTIENETQERCARNALRQDSYALKEWPVEANTEFTAFTAFKSDLIVPLGMKRALAKNRSSTIAVRRQQQSLFFGWLAERRTNGIIPVSDLSMTLLMVPSLLHEYMQWKAQRSVGEARVSATDVDLVTLAGALTNAADGFLTQRPDLAPRLTALLQQHHLSVRRRDGTLWTMVTAVDWLRFCEDAYREIKAVESTLRRVQTKNRRFQELMPVLAMPDPLIVVYRAIDAMRIDLNKLERSTTAYARAQRGLMMMHISTQVALRAETWTQVTASGAEPDLHFEQGRWQFKIPARKIKTGDLAERFKSDPFYRRELLDDNGLYDDISEYLDHSRPLLLGDSDCDRLIVNNEARPVFSKAYLQNVFRAIVRRNISRYAENENAQRNLDDFSFHPLRHILATAILKRSGSFELAGDALADDPETVREYYGFWRASDRSKDLLKALGRRAMLTKSSPTQKRRRSKAYRKAPFVRLR
ncbi:helix-turn-helix domain-containing protein [Aureimonas phyllosphaerae]|uniref:helix-turn-helix domain-containing protein n=1 Tax=Aureimonas phyllosphaerae TaxID=1166078 RepID=UPI003A5C5785